MSNTATTATATNFPTSASDARIHAREDESRAFENGDDDYAALLSLALASA